MVKKLEKILLVLYLTANQAEHACKSLIYIKSITITNKGFTNIILIDQFILFLPYLKIFEWCHNKIKIKDNFYI